MNRGPLLAALLSTCRISSIEFKVLSLLAIWMTWDLCQFGSSCCICHQLSCIRPFIKYTSTSIQSRSMSCFEWTFYAPQRLCDTAAQFHLSKSTSSDFYLELSLLSWCSHYQAEYKAITLENPYPEVAAAVQSLLCLLCFRSLSSAQPWSIMQSQSFWDAWLCK